MRISNREFLYLLVIKGVNDKGSGATIFGVAKALGVSTASAYEEINHLIRKGLAEKRGDGIYITEEGIREMNSLIRAHRVIETLLVKAGIDPDKACELAKMFDETLPEEVVEKLYEYLGRPSKCPHGREIPST
ncbi:MAG: metal-dependent transcriptional regulator [Vulcanisaeta sp.]|jgi:Mn-dependent DtxR family transcriptional regulator|uniref:metal-dependent transcriptional regulator n=1 Tax=Vulcanisaeta sp. EB80 TaxID=1650660 RepID=UPI0007467308|nr:metal-dependent transcriptional regulator [Vulcanisaeta sp. EB80]KUO80256.1 MAG: DtxR family iron (metal) dependent repressor [Vulcanisaeta sp. JCHS_4]KUO87566.1 MAG: DtxR family iron (metal) dependent repressor [Vulcanisaeta sp. MG_3]KUO94159.1 MAG: DtxR family iron (metal) dependent repressor [Vulcanisaeta sp. CIS_19]MCG2865569.1 metal-dependent transcriptional regulator [Vulcanisaeta sp.]PVU71769.1 metal-dependent transcriptional regulator [Vulcanisaeta sp. SCGC AB-777_J10]